MARTKKKRSLPGGRRISEETKKTKYLKHKKLYRQRGISKFPRERGLSRSYEKYLQLDQIK